MKNLFNSLAAGAVLLGSCAVAQAGDWSVNLDPKGGNRVDVILSFSGDGATEDTQIDVKVKSPFRVLSTDTLMKGSVCVASVEKAILRAVPPSGAGSALAKSINDTCVFSLMFDQKSAMDDFASEFEVGFVECASSVSGAVKCGDSVSQMATPSSAKIDKQ